MNYNNYWVISTKVGWEPEPYQHLENAVDRMVIISDPLMWRLKNQMWANADVKRKPGTSKIGRFIIQNKDGELFWISKTNSFNIDNVLDKEEIDPWEAFVSKIR